MSVGIVANERTMIQPDNALCPQPLLQAVFNLLLRKGLVAMGGHQAACGGKDSSLAVALDGASFEHEVQVIFVGALEESLLIEVTVYLIVERRLKFLTPAVEAEVEEDDV